MLHNFLEKNQTTILARTKAKMEANGLGKLRSGELDRGLPMFYAQLIAVLKRVASDDAIGHPLGGDLDSGTKGDAQRYGREAEKLGYTVSQVIHAYGALCQAITECAFDQGQVITPKEFHGFNFTLDAAVAEAVTEFIEVSDEAKGVDHHAQLGTLAHELRNPLSNAIMALEAIRMGSVGVGGNTGQLLDRRCRECRNSSSARWRPRDRRGSLISPKLILAR